uniref:Uncharacterized protein n=1 Tax=Arundo donax TaxID=35708 RepID=A0A0A9GVP2_ARUDO
MCVRRIILHCEIICHVNANVRLSLGLSGSSGRCGCWQV